MLCPLKMEPIFGKVCSQGTTLISLYGNHISFLPVQLSTGILLLRTSVLVTWGCGLPRDHPVRLEFSFISYIYSSYHFNTIFKAFDLIKFVHLPLHENCNVHNYNVIIYSCSFGDIIWSHQ